MTSENLIKYGGRPLSRSGDGIIYGEKWKEYYAQLVIKESTKLNDLSIATNVKLSILKNPSTPSAKAEKMIVKSFSDLGSALVYAKSWLDAECPVTEEDK